MQNKLVVCNKCGWIHFEVSAEYVRDWEFDWLKLFNEKPQDWLLAFGVTDAPPSTDIYLKCFRCGGDHRNFRDANENDAERGYGHTIHPILNKHEKI